MTALPTGQLRHLVVFRLREDADADGENLRAARQERRYSGDERDAD